MRIGVYSGEIPTSKFIEQMIQDFASKGHEVYVYGTQKGDIDHYKKLSIKPRIFSKNIKILRKYFFLMFLVICEIILLAQIE